VRDELGAGVFWLTPPGGGIVVVVSAYESHDTDPALIRARFQEAFLGGSPPRALHEQASAHGPMFCGRYLGEDRVSAMCISVRFTGDRSHAYVARVLIPRTKLPLLESLGGEDILRVICESAREFSPILG